MTRELRDELAQAEARLSTGPLDLPGAAGLVRRVHRARVVRTTTRGAVAAAAAAAVGLAGYLTVQHRGAGPAPVLTSPSPIAPTPTTPTPTGGPQTGPSLPTTGATGPAASTTVQVPELGSLPQATAAQLRAATAGWSLVLWSPERTGSDVWAPQSAALLLVAPGGTRYHLSDVDPLSGIQLGSTTRWVAGQTSVLVWAESLVDPRSSHSQATIARLDLLSGRLTTVSTLPDQVGVVDWTADGRAVTLSPSGYAIRSPDGTTTPLPSGDQGVVVDPTGRSVATVSEGVLHVLGTDGVERAQVSLATTDSCAPLQWTDSTHVLVLCRPGAATARYVLVDLTRREVATLAVQGPQVFPVDGVSTDGAGLLTFVGTTDPSAVCEPSGIYTLSGTTVRQLAPLRDGNVVFGSGGGVTVVGQGSSCSEASPWSVVTIDAQGHRAQAIPRLSADDWLLTVAGVTVAR